MKKGSLLILTIIGVFILSTFSFGSAANVYPTIKLTENDYHDSLPQINSNGDVVWLGYDGHDYEVFLYERASGNTTQLTNNDYSDSSPQINSNGDVVWLGFVGRSNQVFLFDRASGITTQLTNSDYGALLPQINCDGDVVWLGYDGHDYEIFLYERPTGNIIQLTDNDYTDWSPQINCNGAVVWQGQDGADWEIFIGFGIIMVEIDIRPRGNPNSIDLKSRGVVPVAVLTTEEFDARTLNPYSVTFAGASPRSWKLIDVDRDGDTDMLFLFKNLELVGLTESSTEATLTGETCDGIPIEGTDTVNIVSEGCKRDKKEYGKHKKDCNKDKKECDKYKKHCNKDKKEYDKHKKHCNKDKKECDKHKKDKKNRR